MKKKLFFLAIVAIILVSCRNERDEKINSPLAIIIKLNAAEALMDFEHAKQYQDINRIYSKYCENNMKPEDVWREKVTSLNNLSKDKKFTNQWKYFNYDIIEKTTNSSAEVILKAKNADANLQEVIYELELKKSSWIVNDIKYKQK